MGNNADNKKIVKLVKIIINGGQYVGEEFPFKEDKCKFRGVLIDEPEVIFAGIVSTRQILPCTEHEKETYFKAEGLLEEIPMEFVCCRS